MVEFKKVSYTYYSKFYTLFEFSHIFEPKNYCLVGEDVDGPLTLIRLLAKLDTHYKGEILINNKSLKNVNYKKDFQVAYLSAKPVFFENKSVIDNLLYPLKSRGIKKDECLKLATNALNNFDWQSMSSVKVNTLTNSQKLTLSLIRASVRKLDLLLCENIFDSVDIENIDKIKANTKIIVSPTDLPLTDYEKVYFKLGSKQNK